MIKFMLVAVVTLVIVWQVAEITHHWWLSMAYAPDAILPPAMVDLFTER